MRPSNDLVAVRYSASSNFRACTLRFPSVVSRSFFSSLKVSDSLTESALSIPRRRRSWISRSSLGALKTAGAATGSCVFFSFRSAFCLPAIFHRDDRAENYVDSAEARRQRDVARQPRQQ